MEYMNYLVNSKNEYHLGLCVEARPMFCRIEEKRQGYDSRLRILCESSSILDMADNGKRRIDNECPVIAYGFSAFLLVHSVKDKDEAGFIHRGDWTSARNLREMYLNEVFTKYKEDNRRKYMAADGDKGTITKLASRFFDEHLSKEKELLNKTESLDKGLADGLWQAVRVEARKYLDEVEKLLREEEEPVTPQERYGEYLVELFNNNIHLIDELIGLDDDKIAKKINEWVKQKDKFGKPIIKNPANGLKLKFATELKQNNLIKKSVDSFRRKI